MSLGLYRFNKFPNGNIIDITPNDLMNSALCCIQSG